MVGVGQFLYVRFVWHVIRGSGGDTAVAVVKEAVGQPDNQCNRSRVLGDAAASGPVGDTDRIYAGLVLGTSSVDALGSIFRAHAISRDDHD